MNISVVASHHRNPLIAPYLEKLTCPVAISYTPDYELPAGWQPAAQHQYHTGNHLGAYRCYRGHQDALSQFAKIPCWVMGADNSKEWFGQKPGSILILEDDAVPSSSEWLGICESAADLLTEYDIVSMHGRDWQQHKATRFREFSHAGLTFYEPKPGAARWVLGSLAYLIKPETARKIIERPYDGFVMDLFICSEEFRFCVIEPSPFEHDRRQGTLIE